MKKKNEFMFLANKVSSESARKSYFTLFKSIDEYENHIGTKIANWEKEDCIDFLSGLGSKKYNTIAVKWSLLKKYLFFIGNTVYREITKSDLENIENEVIEYVSFEELFNAVEIFENNLDKALLLMIRSGIKGEEFNELSNLKKKDILGNIVTLSNRKIVLRDDVQEVVGKAKKELGYRMNVKKSKEEGKRIAYSYYRYNIESEFFWRNRPNKFNHEGLDPMKPNAVKTKINNLISRIDDKKISTTSLFVSYVVDKILEIERSLGIKLSELQTKSFVETLGVKVSLYTVYSIKNKMD